MESGERLSLEQIRAFLEASEEVEFAGRNHTNSEFLREFDFVTPESPRAGSPSRSFFFDGAEPTWDDIYQDMDAPRTCLTDFLEKVNTPATGVGCFVKVGAAGSGKSTLIEAAGHRIVKRRS